MRSAVSLGLVFCAALFVPTQIWAKSSCRFRHLMHGEPSALPSVDISVDDTNETVTMSIYNHTQTLITLEDPLRGPDTPLSLGMKVKNDAGPVVNPAVSGTVINGGFISPAIVASEFAGKLGDIPHMITLRPDDHLSRTVSVSSLTWRDFLVPPDSSDTVSLQFRVTLAIDLEPISCETGWYQVHSRALLLPTGPK
jgi:hypothetical protein